jgi:rhamnogalacturonan endolyase
MATTIKPAGWTHSPLVKPGAPGSGIWCVFSPIIEIADRVQNDGSASDAAMKAKEETALWPYRWLQEPSFNSRGSISGTVTLSDGRPAAGAAVFLGENRSNKTTLDQGAQYNYRSYADGTGSFSIPNVRQGIYALQLWPNGGKIGDVTTVFLKNDVKVTQKSETSLGNLTWRTQGRKLVWQVGSVDRKASEFRYAGPPHEHARVDKCAPNLVYTVGQSKTGDWCFAQGNVGVWSIRFNVAPPSTPAPAAILSVSLAGFSSVLSSTITVNGSPIGSLSNRNLKPDSSLPRSGTVAGEWKYVEFPVPVGRLKQGWNTVDFKIAKNTQWRGYMFDSILMEWT